MGKISDITKLFAINDWFTVDGAYVVFDGQYGSTGKGLLASVIAEASGHLIDTVTTNAGPNSGHTAYCPANGTKIMTQQLPIASVMMAREGHDHTCYLNGGAVIDPDILWAEMDKHGDAVNELHPSRNDVIAELVIHPAAVVIKPEHQGEQLSRIASTGKGVGPAMADKLWRVPEAVIGFEHGTRADWQSLYYVKKDAKIKPLSVYAMGRTLVETAQGWSLGINSGFYPYTTSRECSVAQALSDLGVSPRFHRKSIAALRTYPIRVGNHPDGGYSGPVYDDQREITFEEIGQEPELTTVTQRVRRIFTWSDKQFKAMLHGNEPDALFINFMNYLPEGEQNQFIADRVATYRSVMGRNPDFVLGGFGPRNKDVRVVF